MNRFASLPALLSLTALAAVAACSPGADTAADTTAVAGTALTSLAAASTQTAATSTAASEAVIVPININTATDAEILRIPGVGPRMLREFKEYRPYTSIEQFRREIGKYVDKAEVARLEQYIVIK